MAWPITATRNLANLRVVPWQREVHEQARLVHHSQPAAAWEFDHVAIVQWPCVDAGWHDGPGEAELHTWETGIIHVLDGEAIVVTGGEMVDRRQVAPGQYCASAVRAGTT